MKKLLILIYFLVLCISPTAVSIAAEKPAPAMLKKTIGVLFVGPIEFRAPDYFEIASEQFGKRFDGTLYKVTVGSEIQSKYQQYWDNKGFLSEQPATKPDLLAFAQQSGFDYILCLIISAPTIETHKLDRDTNRTRAIFEVRAIYIDSTQQTFVSSLTNSQQDDSRWSALRAKRGAFQKIMEYIAVNLNIKGTP